MRRSEGLGLHAAAVRMVRERTRAFSERPVKRFFIAAILARGCRQSRRQRLAFHALRDELRALLPPRWMRAVPRGTRDQGGETRRLSSREAIRAHSEERS